MDIKEIKIRALSGALQYVFFFRTVSVMVMLVFLFVTIVILLNILIAQLSDTYTKIQGDANRELEVRMAQIIARIEQNPLLPCCVKVEHWSLSN